MKNPIEIIVKKRYLQWFNQLALDVRHLGLDSSDLSMGDVWTKAINGMVLDRCKFNKSFCG